MTGKDLKLGREEKGWTQEQAAARLSVSQPYLSLMEKGARPVPDKLARKAATAFGLSATTLPVETSWETVQPKDANTLASASPKTTILNAVTGAYEPSLESVFWSN